MHVKLTVAVLDDNLYISSSVPTMVAVRVFHGEQKLVQLLSMSGAKQMLMRGIKIDREIDLDISFQLYFIN